MDKQNITITTKVKSWTVRSAYPNSPDSKDFKNIMLKVVSGEKGYKKRLDILTV